MGTVFSNFPNCGIIEVMLGDERWIVDGNGQIRYSTRYRAQMLSQQERDVRQLSEQMGAKSEATARQCDSFLSTALAQYNVLMSSETTNEERKAAMGRAKRSFRMYSRGQQLIADYEGEIAKIESVLMEIASMDQLEEGDRVNVQLTDLISLARISDARMDTMRANSDAMLGVRENLQQFVVEVDDLKADHRGLDERQASEDELDDEKFLAMLGKIQQQRSNKGASEAAFHTAAGSTSTSTVFANACSRDSTTSRYENDEAAQLLGQLPTAPNGFLVTQTYNGTRRALGVTTDGRSETIAGANNIGRRAARPPDNNGESNLENFL